MAWIAKYRGVTHGPYPNHVHDDMKQSPALQGWKWEKVEDPEFTPPIKPKKSKKKESPPEITGSEHDE